MELCGGTHVGRAGDIGLFKIVSESGVAAGIRRIEAVTGQGALDWVANSEALLRGVAGMVKASREDVEDKIGSSLIAVASLKEVAQLKSRLASGQGNDLSALAVDVAGIQLVASVVEGADVAALREALIS
jgi:alanyl-tRNA synthetase